MSETIAVLGASADRSKYGNKCVRAYASAGWRVFPVNLRETEIEGLPAYSDLEAVAEKIGGRIHRISVYLPPETTRGLLAELAAAGAEECFFNPGSADPETLQEATRIGIVARDACSIVDIGLSPSLFP